MNIPGLEKMDPESRAQAVQSYLINEVEKLQKVIDGMNLIDAKLEERVKVLEVAREVQKQLNLENAEWRKVVGEIVKPKPKLKTNWIAKNLLNKLRKK